MNRLDMVKDSSENVIADYAYGTLSRRTQVELLNGTRTEYGYNSIDRLTSLLNKKASPETIFSEYLFGLYDNVGNLKQMSRDGDGYTFDYDAIYQLKTVDYPEGHHSADKTNYYDALGNRTSIIGGGLESYTTNALNQYTKVGGVDFSYDGDGNLTSDGANTYAYDSENRLTSTGSYTYTYDPFGRRTRKQGPGTDITYIYDGAQVIEEQDSGGSVLATYVYGPGIDECISMTRGGQTYYYHYDRLGSVVNLSNSSGDLVETYHYDAWGNADTYGSVDNPYFFTGRRYDPETGIYYFRTRYYHPRTGRFMQTDPLYYFDGPNLYEYVTNNPLNLIDPFGLCKSNKKQIPIPLAPPGVDINKNIREAMKRLNPSWFYNQVKNKGPWDYKQLGKQYEAFGNFNYGATGAAFGFSERTLLREAGRAQIRAKTSKPKWNKPGSRLNPFGGKPPYGDDPRDQELIKQGVKYFESLGLRREIRR